MRKLNLIYPGIFIIAFLCAFQSKSSLIKPKDISWFIDTWDMFSFTLNEKGDTTYLHYTEYSSGCKSEKKCNPNADVVAFSFLESDSTLLDMYWLYEKGGQIIKFTSDDFFIDQRIYTNDPYIWKSFKVDFINENQFVLHNWRWENSTSIFKRKNPKK